MPRLRTILVALPLLLSPSVHAGDDATAPLAGEWEGTLATPGGDLRLRLRIADRPDGGHAAELVSVDQGGAVLPVARVIRRGWRVRLELDAIGGTFDGGLRGGELGGNWVQGGAVLPLTFRRAGAAPPPPRRPQLPAPPLPYREEEVSFESPAAGARLAGTLTLPPGSGPFAAVLLVSGSGPQDRDETLLGHKPFLVLADHLARRGLATLRVDDRGVGGSGGSLAQATTADLAGDARAALAFLRGRKEIDPRRVGIVGHSEGANVGALVAGGEGGPAFLVMLAGMGVPGEQVLLLQGWRQLEASGAPAEQVARERAWQEGLHGAVRAEPQQAGLERRILALAERTGKPVTAAQAAALAAQLGSPWFRHFLAFDPGPSLRAVRCPVLALQGEKDVQVTARENAPAVEAALRAGGNADATVRVLPGLNHLFQTCRTCAVTEYGQLEETFAPAALEALGAWVAARAAAGAR